MESVVMLILFEVIHFDNISTSNELMLCGIG